MTPLFSSIFAASLLVTQTGGAGDFTSVRPIEGYRCFRVYIPEERRFDRSAVPPVFAAPTEASKLIGHSGVAAFVKWPMNEVDGFVEIIWGGQGLKAWIHKDVLRPWRTKVSPAGPASECVPTLMSNGRIGVGNAIPYKHE
ncbi:hypothetical protein FM996_20275 [Methylosinus sporium]|uniref:Uncharacterized protein n=1 Tax=Methylosinus sporium TaxID=428 RepID=A0A549SD83_METSR|nr:hypothetical protein [Methylosinus sporium]TRL24694.1 hypothetical protein FM996_20275 [Methylosinus sporium]